MKERHVINGGWRSDTPSRHSEVNEAPGKSPLPAGAFTTDSNRAETDETAPIQPDFIPR